jgi:hypothetical protein
MTQTLKTHGAAAAGGVRAAADPLESFERQWADEPQATAVWNAGRVVAYRVLGARIAAVQRALLAAGVLPGDRVGLSLRRGPDLVAAVHAVLRCGAALAGRGVPRSACTITLVDEGIAGARQPSMIDLRRLPEADELPPRRRVPPSSPALVANARVASGRCLPPVVAFGQLHAAVACAAARTAPDDPVVVCGGNQAIDEAFLLDVLLPPSCGGGIRLDASHLRIFRSVGVPPTLLNVRAEQLADLEAAGLPVSLRTVNVLGPDGRFPGVPEKA